MIFLRSEPSEISISVPSVNLNFSILSAFLSITGVNEQNTKIRVRSIQTASAKSGMVDEGAFSDNVAVDISKMGFKKAPIGIPVAKGYLEPRINSITTSTLNLGFYNAGPGNHSGECKVILIELY